MFLAESCLDTQNSNLTRKAIKKWTIRAGNWGQGLFSFIFSDTNLADFEETFFLINDKAMRWIAIPRLPAFSCTDTRQPMIGIPLSFSTANLQGAPFTVR